eukprot:c37588_g1_i1.p1 GENE.c37588_g1_i1~~c37588_g1_i1.p1  ORF type:complete len:107 (-),score=17.38 c37588_g1_i1:154-474(-)
MQITKNIIDYSAFVIATNAAYAEKHGYKLMIVMSEYDKQREEIIKNTKSHKTDLLDKTKVLLVKERLKYFEWIVWLDADSMIVDFSQKNRFFYSSKQFKCTFFSLS